MSDRYDATIQLKVKRGRKYEVIDTWEFLKDYFRESKECMGTKIEDCPEDKKWMHCSFNFSKLFADKELEGFDGFSWQFYWLRKQGTAVSGTYSYNFPMEALVRALKVKYPEATSRWVFSSTFRGGCK